MKIPHGIIVAWPGTVTPLPAGWTRVTALDARHTRGAVASADAGASGGSTSHTHGSDTHNHGAGVSHTHTGSTSPSYPPPPPNLQDFFSAIGGGGGVQEHTHDVPAALAAVQTFSDVAGIWNATTVEPVSYGVLWLVSDGTPTDLPPGCIVWFDSGSVPGGGNWAQHVGSESRFLKGADTGANGGTLTGSATHTHTAQAHAHQNAMHVHTMASPTTTAPSGSVSNTPLTSLHNIVTPIPAGGHVHSLFPLPLAPTDPANTLTSSNASGAPGNATLTPAFYTLMALSQIGVAAVVLKNAICLWLGTLANIPLGWALCDGSSGTPDLRQRFILAAASGGGDVDTTGADTLTGHTHTSPATHSHTDTGHTHPFFGAETADTIILISTSPPGITQHNICPPGHDHRPISGPASVATGALTGDTQDVTAALGDPRPPFTDVLFLSSPGEQTVTVTAPLDASTVTVDNPTVTWTIGVGETQLSYALTIYADDGTTVVYATGQITSAVLSAVVPALHIRQLKFYKVVVESLSTTRDLGTSPTNRFQAVFTPSPTITGLTAVAQPNGTPPSILLNWDAIVVSAGQSYVQTNVERRPHGSGPWGVISVLTVEATRSFNDYTAIPGVAYDYAVTVTTLYGLDDLVSAEQGSPPEATLFFLGVWIHLVADPTQYLLFHQQTDTAQPGQDMRLVPVWGRKQPTAHVGEQEWQEWTIVGAPYGWSAEAGPLPQSAWEAFEAFVAAAAVGGAAGTLMYRHGNNDEGAFVQVNWSKSSRAGQVGYYVPTLVLQEVFYDPSGG